MEEKIETSDNDISMDKKKTDLPDINKENQQQKWLELLVNFEEILKDGLNNTLQVFDKKLAYDKTKQKQIDALHNELQEYKADFFAKFTQPIIQAVIHLYNDIERLVDSLNAKSEEELNIKKLLKIISGIGEDIEVLLSQNGIDSFRENNQEFNPKRQSVVKKIPSSDELLAGQVVESIRPGFEQGNELLHKEKVSVYVFEKPSKALEFPLESKCVDTVETCIGFAKIRNNYGISVGGTYSSMACCEKTGKIDMLKSSNDSILTASTISFRNNKNITGKNNFISYEKKIASIDIYCKSFNRLIDDLKNNKIFSTRENIVISVPIYFDTIQKKEINEAAIIAGLKRSHIITDPVSATLHYESPQEKDQIILVYDLGGTSFTATVIEIKYSRIRVICSKNTHTLGGRNWDEILFKYFIDCILSKTGHSSDEISKNEAILKQLIKKSEVLKIKLSTKTIAVETACYDVDACNNIEIEITREKFEAMTSTILEETFNIVDEIIDIAKSKDCEKIDSLLLVGGSSIMPQVKSGLEKRFAFDIKLNEPNFAIAKGAAKFGQMIANIPVNIISIGANNNV